MRFFEQLLLILGLAMDGFAASICMGVSLSGRRQAVMAAAVVTGCHVLLFAAGHTLGAFCAPVAAAAPWIGGGILAALGVNMLREARQPESGQSAAHFELRHAAALGVSTSVDAMTTGFSFALLGVGLAAPLGLVAVVMGALSLCGVWAGRRLGRRFRHLARLGGGALLLAMGVKSLLSLV